MSTSRRPQRNSRMEVVVQPPRLIIRRWPRVRAASSESIGEQIEVEPEWSSTPQGDTSDEEWSLGSQTPSPNLSHVSYASVHSQSPEHSSSSHQAEEPHGGFTDINNADLKALLAVSVTPFSVLPETLKMQLINSTSPDVIDVDTWAISMSPRYYGQHFCNVLVTTLCRSDTRNLHLSLPPNQSTSTSDDRGRSSKFSLGSRHLSSPFGFFPAISLPSRLPRAIYTCSATLCSRLTIRPRDSAEYTGWTALAMTGHVIFIHPSYSKPFIEHMGEHRPIEPSSDERYITHSSLVVPMLEILQSLEAIDCPMIRVVCYGQKRRITDYSVPSEPAQPEHYKANTNLWDIGVNVHSDKIFLFRP
ncbi:hypothetical protein C345_01494 [Cryptococcus neoformans A2-102-5]|nr:hypothetical protein C345_01494 [Cryptococcus neoformans var. grubii A2-102-5]